MYYVGLTGGIGSGKSLICKMFGVLGIPYYNADEKAKDMINTDRVIHDKLIKEFGNDIYTDNKVNKEKLGEIIFNSTTALKKVNSIVHPRVINDFFLWAKEKEYASYVILESAIIFENELAHNFDMVITVSAPEEMRLQRVMQRDGVDKIKVRERINNQMSDEEKNTLADMCIINNEQKLVLPQVLNVHDSILKKLN